MEQFYWLKQLVLYVQVENDRLTIGSQVSCYYVVYYSVPSLSINFNDAQRTLKKDFQVQHMTKKAVKNMFKIKV